MGLCLPISSIAALVATLPTTASSASITCHWRGIAFFVGNSVLIDTLLSQRVFQSFRLAGFRGACQIGLQLCRIACDEMVDPAVHSSGAHVFVEPANRALPGQVGRSLVI